MVEKRGMMLPVLMTASVSTRGMKRALFSDEERERMYLETLIFYIREILKDPQAKIVFAENSGWDLKKMSGKLPPYDHDRLEFVALDPSDFDISKGKGYNEFLLIRKTLDKSRIVKSAGAFLKVTGRYPIFNLMYFLRAASKAFYSRGCVFYGDMKDHSLYDRLHLPFEGHIGSSVLFACTIENWMKNIESRRILLNDERGYWAEHLIYDYMKPFRGQKNSRIISRFGRELRCGGRQGSASHTFFFFENNLSSGATFHRMVGNFIRFLLPFLWF